jgi:hypothetical protein
MNDYSDLHSDGLFDLDSFEFLMENDETTVSFDDCSGSDNAKNIGLIYTNVRRNRPYKRRKRLIPKQILKNDIRNHYVPMFLNVYNSLDHKILTAFLSEYCCRCSFQMKFHGFFNYKHAPNLSFVFDGINNVANGIGSACTLSPDNTIRYFHAKSFHALDSEESYIVAQFTMNATQIFDTSKILNYMVETNPHTTTNHEIISIIDKEQYFTVNHLNSEGELTTQYTLPAAHKHTSIIDQLPLLQEPFHTAVSGIVKFTINSEKYITKLEYFSQGKEFESVFKCN